MFEASLMLQLSYHRFFILVLHSISARLYVTHLLSCRVSGSNENPNFFCSCGDSESQSCGYEEPLPGI